MADKVLFRAEGDNVGRRLDVALANTLSEKSRQAWHELIGSGRLSVNNERVKPSQKLRQGDEVTLLDSLNDNLKTGPSELKQNIDVLYQDDAVIVVDKPAGVLVHPTEKDEGEPTLARHFASLIEQDGTARAGIVHRLDKDTSGVMVLARTLVAAEDLRAQFKARSVAKSYWALVWGKMADERARIELPMARSRSTPTKMSVTPEGRSAVTEYEVTAEYDDYSLLYVRILTGRMHQIRVHFAYLGHPVVGDEVYGKQPTPPSLSRQFLHAHALTFTIPGGERRSFNAPLPTELQDFLKGLDV